MGPLPIRLPNKADYSKSAKAVENAIYELRLGRHTPEENSMFGQILRELERIHELLIRTTMDTSGEASWRTESLSDYSDRMGRICTPPTTVSPITTTKTTKGTSTNKGGARTPSFGKRTDKSVPVRPPIPSSEKLQMKKHVYLVKLCKAYGISTVGSKQLLVLRLNNKRKELLND